MQLCAAKRSVSGRDAFVGSLEGEPMQGCWNAGSCVLAGGESRMGSGEIRVGLEVGGGGAER